MQRGFITSCFALSVFACGLFGGISSVQAAVSATAQLDRATIMAGETATLTVTIEGGAPQSADPLPPISGLSVQYRGNTRSIMSVNGRTSIKHLLNYTVSASEPGRYIIPAITVRVDGINFATQPVSVTVVKSDPSAQNRYAFLRLNVPKNEVYVGEIIPIELQLYVVDAENLQAPQLKSESFVIHKQLEHTRSQAQVGNILYSVLTFRMSISAAKAGKLTLGPAEMNLVLRLRAQPDPNDVFGFFGRFQRRPIAVTSPAVEINVLPLPAPVPPDFSGAIGSFQWTVSATPTNVNAGDPITLRAVVTGRGNLDNVKLPDFNWPDIRTYQPTSSVASSDPLGIEGSKTFEQVLVPQGGSVREIPAFSLAYFDPAKNVYLKLEQAATPLQVKGSASSANSSIVTANGTGADEPLTLRSDIVHIKADPGHVATLGPPLLHQPWFLVLQGIPLLGVIGLTVWRKRQEQLANNPRLRRRLEVHRALESGLAELRSLASASEAEQFHALLFRLMQEQIGERLELPASAITEAVLDERLPRRGASPELIQELHHLFQISNQARYAPTATNAELLSLSSELENAVRELQKLPDR
jgi:hypothetical protein